MSFFDPDYNSRADYDLDGKVDDFEYGMFLHEMEEEDRAIEEGRAFFGSGRASYEPKEDYIGLDLEQCTILDPNYDGTESLDELASRYGIDLTEEDVQFYRESQEPSVSTRSAKGNGNSVVIDAQVNQIIDDFLMEHSPAYRKSVQESETIRRFQARGKPAEALESWKKHAPKEDLAKYRARRRSYIGEWALAIGMTLLVLAIPVEMIWLGSDDKDVGGVMAFLGVVGICVVIGFAIKLLGPSLGASEAQYKKDVERIIILSNEKERAAKRP